MSHYKILKVNKNATKSEIENAYKKLIIKYHPDKGGNEEEFLRITESYNILKDKYKRDFYDCFGDKFLKNDLKSYILVRIFSRTSIVLYILSFIMLIFGIYSFPIFFYYKIQEYSLFEVLFSYFLFAIAYFNGIIKLKENKKRFLVFFIIISYFYILISTLFLCTLFNISRILLFFMIFFMDFIVVLNTTKEIHLFIIRIILGIIIIFFILFIKNLIFRFLIISSYILMLLQVYKYLSLIIISIPLIVYFLSIYFVLDKFDWVFILILNLTNLMFPIIGVIFFMILFGIRRKTEVNMDFKNKYSMITFKV